MILWFLIQIVIIISSGVMAANKNRSVAGWIIGTALFTPVIIVLAILKPQLEFKSTCKCDTASHEKCL